MVKKLNWKKERDGVYSVQNIFGWFYIYENEHDYNASFEYEYQSFYDDVGVKSFNFGRGTLEEAKTRVQIIYDKWIEKLWEKLWIKN